MGDKSGLCMYCGRWTALQAPDGLAECDRPDCIEKRKYEATPAPGTVRDVDGNPRPSDPQYPLYASCMYCGKDVRCADGTADWVHTADYRSECAAAN